MKYKHKTQVINIRNKTEDIITNPKDIKMIIRAHNRKFYTHTFDNLEKCTSSVKNTKTNLKNTNSHSI